MRKARSISESETEANRKKTAKIKMARLFSDQGKDNAEFVLASDISESEKNPLEPTTFRVSIHDQWGTWRVIEPSIVSRLPLNISCETVSVHSKTSSNTTSSSWTRSFRTQSERRSGSMKIQKFQVKNIEFVNELEKLDKSETTQKSTYVVSAALEQTLVDMPLQWYRQPYCSIYIVKCENTEEYRNIIRQQIKSWIKKYDDLGLEYLILYTPLGTASSKTYKTIYSKISSEFCKEKDADRSCKLELFDKAASGGNASLSFRTQWNNFMESLSGSIMRSFQRRCSNYENAISDLKSQETQKGKTFNYNHFFLICESFAFTYIQARLLSEALSIYDELEHMFHRIHEKEDKFEKVRMQGRMIGEKEDGALVLALHDKAYRHKIASEKITVLEFHKYLFARQANILLAMDDLIEYMRRSLRFVEYMSKEMQHYVSHGKESTEANTLTTLKNNWLYSATNCLINTKPETALQILYRIQSSEKNEKKPNEKSEAHKIIMMRSNFLEERSGHTPRASSALSKSKQKMDFSRKDIRSMAFLRGELLSICINSLKFIAISENICSNYCKGVSTFANVVCDICDKGSRSCIFEEESTNTSIDDDFYNFYLKMLVDIRNEYEVACSYRKLEVLKCEEAAFRTLSKDFQGACKLLNEIIERSTNIPHWNHLHRGCLLLLAYCERHILLSSKDDCVKLNYWKHAFLFLTSFEGREKISSLHLCLEDISSCNKSAIVDFDSGFDPSIEFHLLKQGEIHVEDEINLSLALQSKFPVDLPIRKITLCWNRVEIDTHHDVISPGMFATMISKSESSPIEKHIVLEHQVLSPGLNNNNPFSVRFASIGKYLLSEVEVELEGKGCISFKMDIHHLNFAIVVLPREVHNIETDIILPAGFFSPMDSRAFSYQLDGEVLNNSNQYIGICVTGLTELKRSPTSLLIDVESCYLEISMASEILACFIEKSNDLLYDDFVNQILSCDKQFRHQITVESGKKKTLVLKLNINELNPECENIGILLPLKVCGQGSDGKYGVLNLSFYDSSVMEMTLVRKSLSLYCELIILNKEPSVVSTTYGTFVIIELKSTCPRTSVLFLKEAKLIAHDDSVCFKVDGEIHSFVLKEDVVYLSFKVVKDEQSSDVIVKPLEVSLQLTYAMFKLGKNSNFDLIEKKLSCIHHRSIERTIPFSVVVPNGKYALFTVDKTCNDNVDSGTILNIQYLVSCLRNNNDSDTFSFKIDTRKGWIVSGSSDGELIFDDNGSTVVMVDIFPVKSGKVQLPMLEIYKNSHCVSNELIERNSVSDWISVKH